MPSTVVSTIHYLKETHTLVVTFLSGAVYQYRNVPEAIYRAMKAASSKGQYLNAHIKGHYEFEKTK